MGSRWSENLVVGSPHRLIAHGPLPDTRPSVPAKSRRRATDRFAKPQLIYSQWGFFASPRYRTLAHPKIRVITKNAGSTFARTFDFVRFRARSVSLSGRGRWALVCTKLLALGACCRMTSRCPLYAASPRTRVSFPCSNSGKTWLSCPFAAVAATE